MGDRQYSVSPTGEKFPIPTRDEDPAELERLERMVAKHRDDGKEIVVVVGGLAQ